jgi:hypothetical protein
MRVFSRHTGTMLAIFFLAVLVVSTFPVIQVQANPDLCWTSKNAYKVGETVRFYFKVDTDDQYYWGVFGPDWLIWTQSGGYGPYDLRSYRPGTYGRSVKAGYPIGDRHVYLWDDDLRVYTAWCGFTVVPKTYTITVTAKDYVTRRGIPNAGVFLDGSYLGSTNSGGRLVIRDVPEGLHKLRIERYGYATYPLDIIVFPLRSFTVYVPPLIAIV